VALALRDADDVPFEQLIDLCGIDYSTHATRSSGLRYAVVCHLMSVQANLRIRLRASSRMMIFPSWHRSMTSGRRRTGSSERRFDLFGIMFAGHGDLRRLLTDYGFVGHPFRKDFPISGHVEMRYDPEQKRVIYQPVSIAPREVTPRVVREENYGDVGHG
jgi:NADH-quinone oxidoreductase subunit C